MSNLDRERRILRVSKSYVNCCNSLAHIHAYLCCTVSRCSHLKILNAVLLTRIHINVTRDTRESPEVLVLKVSTVTPAEDLEGDEVLACLYVFGNIKTCL